jgi:signal transduction histidine kinase
MLTEAADLLGASLDYETSLASLANLAVRFIADFCIIDVVEDGQVQRRQIAHSDPDLTELAWGLMEFPPGSRQKHPSLLALESRRPVRLARVTRAALESMVQGEHHQALVEALHPRSLMAVPMLAHDRVLGVVLLVSSSRRYLEEDLVLAERLVGMAALAVDNARLYRTATAAITARDRILGIVAHDLRNPLNTITLTAELLVEEAGGDSHRMQLAQLILRSSARMNRLIDDLRDVSRIEAGRLNLQREIQDPLRLAAEAVELSQPLASGRSLTLAHGTREKLPPVLADRDRILQVLTNLIGNAIKFTPVGGRIEVRVNAARDGVRFSVSDTGSGIPAESLPRLFEPFWQGEGLRREGMGLGLTIARGIVDAHGGSITAQSEPNLGSTFEFIIPAASPLSGVERRRGPADRRGRSPASVRPSRRRMPRKESVSHE